MNEKYTEYIYVLSNPSFVEDLLKIGFTAEHPSLRAKNLHSSGVPTPFKVEGVIITSTGHVHEQAIHKHFENFRHSNDREFFKISKDKLFEILKNDLKLEVIPVDKISPPRPVLTCVIRKLQSQLNDIEDHALVVYQQFKQKKNCYKCVELPFNEIMHLDNENSHAYFQALENKYVFEPFEKNIWYNLVDLSKNEILNLDSDHRVAFYKAFQKVCGINREFLYGEERRVMKKINNDYYFIIQDIIYYIELLDQVNTKDKLNKIKDKIGSKIVSNDHRDFKNMMKLTQNRMKQIMEKLNNIS
tara:strand:+ start:7865 stop:8767 length:903 start_codon:yes stop_codon:yes gene_type:complete